MIWQVYIGRMSELEKLESELVRAKAEMSDATVAALQEKLEIVKSTLCDDVPDKDKVRWLRGFLGC
jgi:hypothetical protein